MTSTTKAWLYGAGTTFISAFSTAATGALTLPTVFNTSHDGMWNVVKLTVVPALINLFSYLAKSPLPSSIQTTNISITKEESK